MERMRLQIHNTSVTTATPPTLLTASDHAPRPAKAAAISIACVAATWISNNTARRGNRSLRCNSALGTTWSASAMNNKLRSEIRPVICGSLKKAAIGFARTNVSMVRVAPSPRMNPPS